MEPLRIDKTDDSPLVILDPVDNQFELSGKSLPENAVEFYAPVLDWLADYKEKPLSSTEFNIKLIYFNTASSKMILDILLIFEEMIEEGHKVLVRWHAARADEDMQEAGREFEEMIDVPFEHQIYG
jgi:hypothetical protein